jgi:hypothetical protein
MIEFFIVNFSFKATVNIFSEALLQIDYVFLEPLILILLANIYLLVRFFLQKQGIIFGRTR